MKNYLAIFLFCLPMAALAQSTFIAYQVNGSVNYVAGNKKVKLKIGQKIPATTVVIIAANSSVILISDYYNTTVLNTAGKYSLTSLKDQGKKPVNSVTSEYFKYIWDQFSHAHDAPETNRKKNMNNYGAAVRSGCPGIIIESFLDTVNYFSGDFSFKWKLVDKKDEAKFLVFKNEQSAFPALTLTGAGDTVSINAVSGKLPDLEYFFWQLQTNSGRSCKKYFTEIWTPEKFTTFCNDFLKNFESLSLTEAEKSYSLGYYLERNHFFADALRLYKRALELNPAQKLYQKTITEFINAY